MFCRFSHTSVLTPTTSDFEVLHFAEEEEGDHRQGGPAWLDGIPQDDELLFFDDHENIYSTSDFDGRGGDVIQQQQQHRPRSKADLRREDLLSAVFRVTM